MSAMPDLGLIARVRRAELSFEKLVDATPPIGWH